MTRLNISGSENVEGTDVSQTLRLFMDKLSESYRFVWQGPSRSARHSEWVVFINTRGVCSWQESRETMQGALPGGGQPAAETTFKRVSPRVGGEPPPLAAGPTPPLHAAAHGQHLHSLSQGGPG